MKIYNKLVISMITGEILEEDSYEYEGAVILARGEKNKSLESAEYSAMKEREEADRRTQQTWEQQQQDRTNLLTKYQGLYDNPMSAEERASGLATAGGPFDAAQTVMEARSGRTGNYSGLAENEDQLARERSQALAQEQGQLDQQSIGRKLAALQGMSSLYGVDAQTMAKLMGLPAEYLQIQSGAAGQIQPGFGQIFTDSLASGLGTNLAKAFDPASWYKPA